MYKSPHTVLTDLLYLRPVKQRFSRRVLIVHTQVSPKEEVESCYGGGDLGVSSCLVDPTLDGGPWDSRHLLEGDEKVDSREGDSGTSRTFRYWSHEGIVGLTGSDRNGGREESSVGGPPKL